MKTEYFYNLLSPFYPVIDFFLWPQKRVLLREVNGQPHGQLLEIGVGNGSHLRLYKTHSITAIDTSSSMLNVASRRKTNRVELLQMDGESLAFPDNCFDYVVLSHVLAVVNDPEKLMSEVDRVLKPYGRIFILNHFTPDNWMKHIDYSFNVLSRAFHFRSVFHVTDLRAFKNFSLLKEVDFGSASYFKLLIYLKR